MALFPWLHFSVEQKWSGPDPQGNQGTFVLMYRKPQGRKEGGSERQLLPRGQRCFTCKCLKLHPKSRLENKASYPCVKVAEPSYSGYTVWKDFTTPTTRLNHFTVILPFLMGLLTALLRRGYNSAGIIKGLTNVHTALVGHWATPHTPCSCLERIPQTHLRESKATNPFHRVS